MKKFSLSLCTLISAVMGLAQGSQDFENVTPQLTNSYADGSFTENGITYSYRGSSENIGTGDNYPITGKGIILQRASDGFLEWTTDSNGIGTLSFKYRKAFTGASDRQLEVLVNGTQVATSPVFGNVDGADDTVHTFTFAVNKHGATTIKIKIVGSSTTSRQTTIDDIVWTGFPSGIVFEEDFSSPSDWELKNKTYANKWHIGSAVGNPANALYISSNEGVDNVYRTDTISRTHALKLIAFPSTTNEFSLTFDWKGMAGGLYDYMRVWLIPKIRTAPPEWITTGNTPGAIQIGGDFNQKAEWQTETFILPNTIAGDSWKLVFEWLNDPYFHGTNPPAAVDNILIKEIICVEPTDLVSSNITTSGVDISWTAGALENSWEVEWGETGFTPGTNTEVGSYILNVTNYSITGLTASTSYDVYVRANCGPNQSSWGTVESFTTLDVCNDVTLDAVTTFTQTTADITWTAGGLETSWEIQWGTTGFIPGTDTEIGSYTSNVANYSITGLTANTSYDVYVRADCGPNQSTWGTVESFTTDPLPCNDVSNVSTSNVTTTSVDVSWTANNGETTWNIEYVLQGDSQGSGTTISGITTNPYTITGLTPNTNYDVYIQADCGPNQSTWGTVESFTTAADTAVCNDVTLDAITSLTETTADITWTAGGLETSWEIEWGTTGFTPGTNSQIGSDTSNVANYSITGLTPNTNYDVYVRADCGPNQSTWGTVESFTTLEADDVISRSDFTQSDIKLFPNPTSDFVTISSEEAIKSASVYNLLGQQILQNAEINNEQLDLRLLSSGTYLLKITLENGSSEMFKVVKR